MHQKCRNSDNLCYWHVTQPSMSIALAVMIVRRVSEADAVLGLRSSVKADAALRKVAKVRHDVLVCATARCKCCGAP
eukprot:930356-Pelagomonas_calceolata.AAC.1